MMTDIIERTIDRKYKRIDTNDSKKLLIPGTGPNNITAPTNTSTDNESNRDRSKSFKLGPNNNKVDNKKSKSGC